MTTAITRVAVIALAGSCAWTADAARSTHVADGFRYHSDPQLPGWVEPAPSSDAPAPDGSFYLDLLDVQVRVEGRDVKRFVRIVGHARDSNGLAGVSRVSATFDPSYQQLTVHRLTVERNGELQDRLADTEFRLLQRESELERQIWLGEVTLTAQLADMRAGDRVHFEYSLTGYNPVFGERYVSHEWLGLQGVAARHVSHRVLLPEGRVLHARIGPPDTRSAQRRVGGFVEYRFWRDAVAPVLYEPGTHAREVARHLLQLSEFEDWESVSRWGAPLYDTARGASQVRSIAQDIRGKSDDPLEQTRLALDFVQQEIRYFATAVGPNSHRPFEVERVLAQRYGDCKDKTLMLLSILRALGIDGEPVLVSAGLSAHADRMLPSPLAFDHVIARVTVAGQTLWLDGTIPRQSGPVTGRSVTRFGIGLPLRAQGAGFEPLPPAAESPRITVVDRFTVSD